jgi:cytidylate kinase
MAIVTVSRQFGSRGEEIARELARRTGFRLVGRYALEQSMRARFGVEPPEAESVTPEPPAGDGNGNGNGARQAVSERAQLNVYADMIAQIAADLAAGENLVLVGRGAQFLFREAPGAFHLRVVAPKAWRAATVAAELGLAPPAASDLVARCDAVQARYIRAVFGSTAHHADLYHLILNTAALDLDLAVNLALRALEANLLPGCGLLSAEAAERIKLRSKIRLAQHVADPPGSPALARASFAHPSERVFARLMEFYGIGWEYEPNTFPIEWNERNEATEAFTPDFYLPELDLYVELTTMKQSLVTRKNRKIKRLRQLYPNVNIRVFYQKDVEDLIFKLGAPRMAMAG